jgi:hypothetical protein
MAVAWQQLTAQLWESEREHYDLYISEIVVAEISEGDPDAVQRRLAVARNLKELPVNNEAEQLAALLIESGGFPEKAEVDALHVALATVHGIDLLLTWNCRHINNAMIKPALRSVCMLAGYQCPEICTPQELLPEEV